MTNIFFEQQVLVLGLGRSGYSAIQLLLQQGAYITGMDKNLPHLETEQSLQNLRKQGVCLLQESVPVDLSKFSLLVVSPGIPTTHPLYVQAIQQNLPVIGEVELACRFLKSTLLGITGTNGKTTVTLLVTHILNHSGRKAKALGNIGNALAAHMSMYQSPNDFLVVELSSYQLETLQSKVIDAAVVLNITPDHLDRYSGIEEYAAVKLRIADCLKPQGSCYIEDRCFKEFQHLISNDKIRSYGYSPECALYTDLKSLFLDGKERCLLPPQYWGHATHDLENIMAAYALCSYVGVTPSEFEHALSSFQKPPHRIQFICEVDGVSFYDDSKGTNIDAVIKAVESISAKSAKIVLIVGGVDKGSSYTPWIEGFQGRVKAICAIGQAGVKIKQELNCNIPVELFKTMDEAVQAAALIAQRGETVLLSPGCSSYDMFKDYAHRGRVFQESIPRFLQEKKLI